MNITGTKKLLILILTLFCAVAAGLGVLFGNAFSSPVSAQTTKDFAYSETENVVKETTEDFSEELSGQAHENSESEEQTEDEYDENFDENVINQIVELTGFEKEFVNFYIHLHGYTAQEVYARLSEEAAAHEHETEEEHTAILEGDEPLPETEEDTGLFAEMNSFRDSYAAGEIKTDAETENEDWFVAPDDVSSYATYIAYTAKSHMTITTGSGVTATGWTTFGSGYSNSSTNGVLGARATVSAPINTKITLNISFHSTTYNFIERETNEHWSKDSLFYVGDHNSNGQSLANKFIIDGDAPTGTVFKVVKYYCTGCGCTGKNYYYSLTAGKAAGSCKYFVYEITVKRTTNPTRMSIKNDGGTLSTTSTANDTLTKTYTGSPARITFTPDLGMGLVSWSASPAGYVTLYSRAVHAESSSTLVLECSTAGTYAITLTSFSNKWADNTTGSLTFYFVVKSQTTTKPKMVKEAGVSANGTSKTVNDTGAKQTVSFYDCDKDYVTVSSNGLYEQSWNNSKQLTLYQTQQGTYTITLSLTNSAGCKWDDGTTDPIIFTFKIAEMMIDVPTIVGVSGNTLSVDYNKGQQSMTLSPALEGQMMVIVNGLTYSYNASAKTVTFNATDAARYEVRLSPSTGFIWADGSSQSISFYFVINALEMGTPVLNEPTAVDGKKTVVYDPTPGSYQTLTIENYDPDGLTFSSALVQHSWTADSSGKGTGTLVLRASNAQTYDVIISCRDNYVWNSSVSTRSISFTLEIERYVLGIPQIVKNTDSSDPLYDEDKILGDTKTIAYEAVRDNNALGYLKLFVGGTNSSQVNVTITPTTNPSNTLAINWLSADSMINFTGTQADNYLIVVTPTSNYQWAKGDNVLRNFKLVISPIIRENIYMDIFNPTTNSWEARNGTRKGNLTYTSERKYFRIGATGEYFQNYGYRTDEMLFEIADTGSRDTLQRVMAPTADGIIKTIENGYLYFYAVQASTYTVNVTLKNSNYNWRAGGVILDFTLIIDPQEIQAPTIAWGECGGWRIPKPDEVADPSSRTLAGRYDSKPFSLVIQIDTLTMMDMEDILTIEFWSEHDKKIEKNDWGNSSNYSRVIIHATDADYYTCTITIKNPNFGWEEKVPDYVFELIIERAYLDGVTFYYEEISEENKIGQNNSAYSTDYIIETDQHILVKRNLIDDPEYPNEAEKYDQIFYDEMFTYTITDFSTGKELKTGLFYGNSYISLALQDAGDYGLYITPRDNFCWSDGFYYDYQCSFTINPKAVALPTLNTDDKGDQIHYDDNTRLTKYNAQAQHLIIDLGDDYKAFKVDKLPYGMSVDETNHNVKSFNFYAINRGRYQVVVTLANSNYMWFDAPNSDDGQTFWLAIERGAIDIPTAWLEEKEGFSAAQAGEGIQLLHQNTNVEWVEYKNAQYYVYLLGDIIKTREVIITVETETNNYNSENLKSQYVASEGGLTAAFEVTMRTANVYKITVEFAKFKDEFGNDDYNYYWKDSGSGSDEQDNTAKTFTLEIKKKAVALPKLADNLSAVMENNNFYTYRTFNYGHHEMSITGYLPGFMSYSIDNSRLKVDPAKTDVDNGLLTVTTNVGAGGSQYASVSNTYRLTMSLDAANEKWDIVFDDPAQEDSLPKFYNLVIEKLAIEAPKVDQTADPASATVGYGDDGLSKWVIYTGERWNSAFIINTIRSRYMNYALASAATMLGTYTESTVDGEMFGQIVVSTAADSDSYDVVFSLKDTANMRWDFPDGNSADLIYSFIVKPIEFKKVQIINDGETDAVYDADSKTVTYNYDYQYFRLENLVLDGSNKYMTIEVISGMFADSQTSSIDETYSTIAYSARSAGKYTVRVRLTQNATWGDGEPRYIDFVFNIEKLQFDTPYIVSDANDDTEVIKDFTKTTSYELNENFEEVLKTMSIDKYDPEIMALSNVAVTVNEGQSKYESYGYDPSYGYYLLSAKKAGTYTMTFRMKDFANMRWKFADKETITFTFRIDKLALANPEIEQTYLIDGETANTPAFTATYDGRRHTVLLNNVLVRRNNADSSEPFMFYTYTSNTDTQDRINVEYLRTTEKDGSSLTVSDIFGDSHTGQFKDTAILPETEVKLENILKFNAEMPGTYTVTVTLTNTENMCWKDSSATALTYTLRISKYEHAAPSVESGKSTVLQYTGSAQSFFIVNAFNGDDAKGFEYETMKLGNAVTTGQDPVWKMVSWKDGKIELQAKEVGTYSLTISIKDTNTTSWRNTTAISLNFTFTISKRTVGANIKYSSPDDPALDASLKGGATSWAISQSVTATLSITGIRERMPEATVDTGIILEMYCYNDSTPNNILNRVVIGANMCNMQGQPNGTYILTYDYDIPFGENNIRRGNYTIVVAQPQATGNYTLPTKTFKFTIAADPAPFDPSMLIWQYTLGDDQSTLVKVPNWSNHTTAATALPLDYLEDGRTYNFSLYMNEAGMEGFDKAGYTDLNSALLTWEVRFSSYSGTRSAHYANTYWVRAKIVAKDPALYSFPDYTTTFYYKINAIKYDLSGLVWDYNSTNPFVFDGTAKAVKLKGTLPSGLTVQNYLVSGYDLNTQIYAGNYRTSVKFISTNKNYQPIDVNNPSTYINDGTFVPVCDWQIRKADLAVEWMTVQDSTGGGAALVYVPILKKHAEKVNYIYEKFDGTEWKNIGTDFSHTGEEKFRVTAELKKSPYAQTSASYNGDFDYARNYELRFVMEPDPTVHTKEFTLGGNSSSIGVYAMVGGTSLSTVAPYNTYKYNGTPYAAQIVVFYDPTGLITDANINVTYYSSLNYNKPLSGAPTEPGKYRIKLSLKNVNFGGETEYVLGTSQFDFEIEKGTFDPADIVWSYSHTDLSNTVHNAHWDTEQKKWVDDVTGEEVTFVYDGAAHNVTLKSKNAALKISNKNYSNINAGKYKTNATYSFDATKWNAPSIVTEFEWVIEKAVLDISLIQWDYEGGFVFTLSGGVAKKYTVGLINVPELLKEYVTYTTVDSLGDAVAQNLATLAGTYTTTATIKELPENSNYVAGEWPSTVSKSCDWEIEQREISVPTNADAWSVFDGEQHNLLTAISFDADWKEYYTISVKYSDGVSVAVNYDGTADYGYIYTAFNAGKYSFTLALKNTVNAKGINVVWADGSSTTTQNQTVELDISKAELTVTGWNENKERSTVIMTCASLPVDTLLDKFISYKFYAGTGIDGTEVSLDTILNTDTVEDFTIAPYVKAKYGNNITITFPTGVSEYYAFATDDISIIPDSDQIQIAGKPIINAYTVNGVTYSFDEDMLKEDHVYVIYSGGPVTFVIDKWDTYYVNYLDVWGGDELTQNEAGTYTLTLVLKRSETNPLYWSKTGDEQTGYVYDRSSVTLKFEIRYLMLDVPSFEDDAEFKLKELTYTGKDLDILTESLTEEQIDKLKTQYGDYVEISGNIGKDAGSYTLYLRIKDEYANTVRWKNGTEFGQQGTFTVTWKINPVYLIVPTLSTSTAIIYDGSEHSVFEALEGYSADAMSPELLGVLQNARLSNEGSRAVNAGQYTATFSLPDSNYAWKDVSGNVLNINDVTIENWKINPKVLDMSGVYWSYSESNPFMFTLDNGIPHEYTLELLGIPEELNQFISYSTNGVAGNKASQVGKYNTVVRLFDPEGDDAKNYSLTSMPPNFSGSYPSQYGDLEINWQIVSRTFAVPEDKELEFDNTVKDLLEIFGIGEGWENYMDVTVEFSADGTTFGEYKVDDNAVVGYSIYNAFYLGYYRLKLSIKTDINKDVESVVWLSGNNALTTDQTVVFNYKQLVIEITGWKEEVEDSSVISTKLDEIKNTPAMNMFEYVITDVDDGKVYTAEEVSTRGTGYTYDKLFRIKPENEYAISTGVKLTFNKGVDNPYRFGNYNFGSQTVVWVPLPEFELAEQDFTGSEVKFKIKNWEQYFISDAFRAAFNGNTKYAAEGFHIADELLSFIYAMDGSLDTAAGTVSAHEAGEYKVKLRFASGINLSWYDSSKYTVVNNALTDKTTGQALAKADWEKLISRYSQTLTYTVNVAILDRIDLSAFILNIPEIIYDGTKKDVRDNYKAFFEQLDKEYGSLIEISGYEGTAAGEYTLSISLKDTTGSCWNLNETEKLTVKVDGYQLSYFYIDGEWKVLYAAIDENGEFIKDAAGNYVEYNNGKYEVATKFKYSYKLNYYRIGDGENEAKLDDNGIPLPMVIGQDDEGNDILAQFVLNEDGTAVRYNTPAGGVSADGKGNYVAVYVLDKDGNKVMNELPDTENGHPVLDVENSTVTIERIKTSTDPLTFKWKIVSQGLVAPRIETDELLVYTSQTINVESYGSAIIGYNSAIMRIEGGTAVNAGEYTAKIYLTDNNYKWYSADGTVLEYVEMKWVIAKATIDFSGISWNYGDDTVYTYTLVNGKAKAYKVELVFPEELKAYKALVEYTTNGTVGANAGRNAGKYVTSFALNIDMNNFEEVKLPEGIAESITWYINKRVLEVPQLNATHIVFDDGVHSITSLLALPENWAEYFDIEVLQVINNILPMPYDGYDKNGDGVIDDTEKLLIHGVGTYRFNLSIKAGINTVATRPNVVWLKATSTPEVPPTDDTEGDTETPAPASYASYMFMILPVEDINEIPENIISVKPENNSGVAADVVVEELAEQEVFTVEDNSSVAVVASEDCVEVKSAIQAVERVSGAHMPIRAAVLCNKAEVTVLEAFPGKKTYFAYVLPRFIALPRRR